MEARAWRQGSPAAVNDWLLQPGDGERSPTRGMPDTGYIQRGRELRFGPGAVKRIAQTVLGRFGLVTAVLGLLVLATIAWIALALPPGTDSAKRALPANRDRETAVMGVSLNGQAKAYPLQALLGVEVLNDDVGGRPVVVTF